MRTILWLLLLTSLVAAVVEAQEKPDFSGSWILQDPPQSSVDIPRVLTIRQPLRRTTARGEPMPPVFLDLTVEKHFESEVRTDTYHIGTEGGTGTFGAFGGSRSTSRFSVRWDGDRLRIETKSYPTSDTREYTEQNEVWWLDEQGRLLITVVDRRSDSEPATRTLTYRRQ
jgi:hypothetical protein